MSVKITCKEQKISWFESCAYVAKIWKEEKKRRITSRKEKEGVIEVGDAFTWSRDYPLRAGVLYGSPAIFYVTSLQCYK